MTAHACIRTTVFLLIAGLLCCPWCRAAGKPAQAGERFDPARYQGKNILLLLYSIDDPRAPGAVGLMKELYAVRKEFNFDVAGVNMNSTRAAEVQRFNRTHQVPFPVYFDTGNELAGRFKIKSGLALIIYNKQGTPVGTKDAVITRGESDLVPAWKGFIGRYVKIGYVPDDVPLLGFKPQVPDVAAPALNGTMITLKKLYTHKPLVLVIFSPNCSHCQHELDFLNGLYTGPEFRNAFEIVAVSRLDAKATTAFVKQKGYGFPVLLDGDGTITSLFPSFIGSVPLSYLVDRSGRINYQHTGFSDYVVDNYIMELRKLCGLPNPPRLNPSGYSGQERCRVCHEQEHVQWSLTRHADAFLSLVRKGKEDDATCIACHVTGFEKPGGYSIADKRESRHFEGVQCESCHGPGCESCTAFTGNQGNKRQAEEWNTLCVTCHTQKESLNFNFPSRFLRVLHGNAPDISSMSRQDREALLRAYREKQNLFDNPAGYAGAEACGACHEPEYKQWRTTAHATAHTTDKARSAAPAKRYRYFTGVDSPGGYPEPGREGVQCESCHGPGERHIKEPDKKGQDYIVSLAGECNSCVVEQICRKCHMPADDPNFDFDAYSKKIRHRQPAP